MHLLSDREANASYPIWLLEFDIVENLILNDMHYNILNILSEMIKQGKLIREYTISKNT